MLSYNIPIKEQLHAFTTNVVGQITNRLQRFWERWVFASPYPEFQQYVLECLLPAIEAQFMGNHKPIIIEWYDGKRCRIRIAWGVLEGKILEKSLFVKWDPQQNQPHITEEGWILCHEFK